MSASQTERIAIVVEAIFGNDTRAILDPFQAAVYLGVSTRQIAQWREEMTGPRYSAMPGGAIRYRRGHLDAWLAKFEVQPDEGGAA